MRHVIAAVTITAVLGGVPPVFSLPPTIAWTPMRRVESFVTFPRDVGPSDPVIAIDTPSGRRVWLDVRPLPDGPPPLKADDRNVLIPRHLVPQSTSSAGEPMRLTTTDTLVGAWVGRWQAADGPAAGPLGVVISRVPGRDVVIGQFTFIAGAISRTMRYEGRLENGSVRFPLVDGGRIVLEAGRDAERALTAGRLSGTWVEHRASLPAPRGTIELQRPS